VTISARTPSNVGSGPDEQPDPRLEGPRPERGPRRSLWPFVLTFVVVAWLMVFVIPVYATLNPANARIPLIPGNRLQYPVLILHVATGTIAMLSGCVQVWPRLRRRHPKVHRIVGRVYLSAVIVGSPVLAALIFFRAGHLGAEPTSVVVGFSMLALLWSGTTVAGFVAARQRRFADHRKWMIRSFACTLSIILSRLAFLAALPFPHLDPRWIEEQTGWFPWVATLLVVQWWLDRSARRPIVMSERESDSVETR
jgi:uncharacterized membrane protein